MMLFEVCFWVCAALLVYIYVGYPLLARALGGALRRRVSRSPCSPAVTVLIAAYNEQEHILSTVCNKLQQQYPADLLEVIVVSDASMDDTDRIVAGIGDPRVRLLRQPERRGKTAALNRAATEAKSEILVFSDANSIYEPNAVRHLVENFADSAVGYVTGRMIYVNEDDSVTGDGCTAYMRYENDLRAAENDLGSIVGVDGGIDAVRRALYAPMRDDQLPDFVLPLQVVASGYRVVYEPRALLREKTLNQSGDEFRMRVRVALRALWALWDMRRLLWSARQPLFAWQLWSHKLLRYLAFVPLLATTASSLALARHAPVYTLALGLHLSLFALALLGMNDGLGRRSSLMRFAAYFMLLNIASAVAAWRFVCRRKQVIWQPRQG